MSTLTGGRQRGGLLRHRDFRLLWIGETTSQTGSAVTQVALPLVAVTTLHAGPLMVGLLTAAVWLPWLMFGLPAGAWVDRVRRRPVLLGCDALLMVLFVSVPVAAWLGVLTIVQLATVALLSGVATVFFATAFQAYLPSLLEPVRLGEGNARLQGSQQAAQIAGPGLGGSIAQLAGAATGLLFDAVSFFVSAACLCAIRAREPAPRDTRTVAAAPGRIRDGLRFLFGDPYLRTMATFGAAANLGLTGIDALLVVFLVRTVGVSAGAVGVLMAVLGLGGVAGAAVATRLARAFGSARAVRLSVACTLPLGLLTPLIHPGLGLVLIAGQALAAAGIVASNVLYVSFRQGYCPPEMLGRVSAGALTLSFSCMPLGALLAGGLGSLVGTRPALWVMAGELAAVAVWLLLSPIRHQRDFPAHPGWARCVVA